MVLHTVTVLVINTMLTVLVINTMMVMIIPGVSCSAGIGRPCRLRPRVHAAVVYGVDGGRGFDPVRDFVGRRPAQSFVPPSVFPRAPSPHPHAPTAPQSPGHLPPQQRLPGEPPLMP